MLDFLLSCKIQLSPKATKKYFAQIVIGLSQLHLNGFIYKDLKPENILINERGELVFTDFEYALHVNLEFTDVLCILVACYSLRFGSDFAELKKAMARFPKSIFLDEKGNLILKSCNLSINLNDEASLSPECFEQYLQSEPLSKIKSSRYSINKNFENSALSAKKSSISDKKLNFFFDSVQKYSLYSLKHISEETFIKELTFKFCHRGGSAEFMAPESIYRQIFSFSSDIWSLGCLLYDLCLGHPLFNFQKSKVSSKHKLLLMEKTLESHEFSQAIQKLPFSVRDILGKLLRMDPQKRSYSLNCSQLLKHSWIKNELQYLFEDSPQPYLPVQCSTILSKTKFFIYNIKYKANPYFHTCDEASSGFKSTENTNLLVTNSQNKNYLSPKPLENHQKNTIYKNLEFINLNSSFGERVIRSEGKRSLVRLSFEKSIDMKGFQKTQGISTKNFESIKKKKKYRLKQKKMKSTILIQKKGKKKSPFKRPRKSKNIKNKKLKRNKTCKPIKIIKLKSKTLVNTFNSSEKKEKAKFFKNSAIRFTRKSTRKSKIKKKMKILKKSIFLNLTKTLKRKKEKKVLKSKKRIFFIPEKSIANFLEYLIF